jgi:hypothetical protein
VNDPCLDLTKPAPTTPAPLIVERWQMSVSQAENIDLAGAWEITFLDNGRFLVTWKGRDAAAGTYNINKDELALTDESGPNMCNGALAKAAYRWAVDGDLLKLTALDDPCNARRFINTLKGWGRKK